MHVFVIEEHTEALEVLSLGVRRGLLPLNSCTMVHLDSHPDLSCFDNILPEHINERTELCHRLRNSEDGISSFILPALAMGLLKNVVWVKPPWTDQIPPGHHQLTFGWTDHKEGDLRMAIATDLSYWFDDGNAVQSIDELECTTTFGLQVASIEEWSARRCDFVNEKNDRENKDSCKRQKTSYFAQSDQQWVLDICLDYFSCANPLQEPDLPEHISTAEEIATMLQQLKEALELQLHAGFCRPPALCIIARSEQDGFTPGAVAAGLEESVLDVLRAVYGELKVLSVPSFEVFYDPQFIRKVK